MIYLSRINHLGIRKGQVYSEVMPNPCSFNASVKDDNGRVVFIPRKYFEIIIRVVKL